MMKHRSFSSSFVAAVSAACLFLSLLDTTSGYENVTRIDCGGTYNTVEGTHWLHDQLFEWGLPLWSAGEAAHISNTTGPAANLTGVERSLRVFNETTGGCYQVPVVPGRYLVRAGFAYYNYDGLNTPPTFNVTLQSVPVATVFLAQFEAARANTSTGVSTGPAAHYKDFITPAGTGEVQLCVVPLPDEPHRPLISSLEVTPMDLLAYDAVDVSPNYIFVRSVRANLGGSRVGPEPQDLGYRQWQGDATANETNSITTERDIYDTRNAPDFIPQKVLQSARESSRSSPIAGVRWSAWRMYPDSFWYFRYYFAEINPEVTEKGSRLFNIIAGVIVNGTLFIKDAPTSFDILDQASPFTAVYTSFVTTLAGLPGSQVTLLAAVNSLENSTYPAILSGVEVYELVPAPPRVFVVQTQAPSPAPASSDGVPLSSGGNEGVQQGGGDKSSSSNSSGGGSSGGGGLDAGGVAAILLSILLVGVLVGGGMYIYHLKRRQRAFNALGAEVSLVQQQSF